MTEERPKVHHPNRRPPSGHIGPALVAVLVIGLFSAPVYAVLQSRSTHESSHSAMEPSMGNVGGTPVDLATLQPSLVKLYRGAKSHDSHFKTIPCFCGCQEGRLEHRNLFDCFVLEDGRGWESHATGCGVCQGEAEMALDLLARGSPPNEVKAQVIDEYGIPQEIRELQEG